MDTKENKKCSEEQCSGSCECKKDKDKKSITERIVDSIQQDIAAIIKTVKETERT